MSPTLTLLWEVSHRFRCFAILQPKNAIFAPIKGFGQLSKPPLNKGVIAVDSRQPVDAMADSLKILTDNLDEGVRQRAR